MSAIENTLKLLNILSDNFQDSNGKSLAETLNISQRQVRNYIKAFRKFGIEIQGEKGVGGGYGNKNKLFKLPSCLTEEELSALSRIKRFLDENDVVEGQEHFDILFHKIRRNNNLHRYDENIMTYQYKYRNAEKYYEKKYYNSIEKAIRESKKIRMVYFSNHQNKTTERVVYPYRLVTYDDFLYLDAFCEQDKKIKTFKVIRIKDLTALEEGFEKELKYEKALKAKGQGVYREEKFKFKAIFYHPISQHIKEIKLSEDQKIEILEEGSILLEATLSNWTEILTWIQGWGRHAKVLAPEKMKIEIAQNLKKTLSYYNTKMAPKKEAADGE